MSDSPINRWPLKRKLAVGVIVCCLLVVLYNLIGFIALIHLAIGGGWRHESEEKLRDRLVKADALAPLTEWSLEHIRTQKLPADMVYTELPVKCQDIGIRSYDGLFVEKTFKVIFYEFGGADNHYGLVVAEQEADLAEFKRLMPTKVLNPWSDHIWYYDELPRLK